jgi:hypothetical protein
MELIIIISIVSVAILSLFLPLNPIMWIFKPWVDKSLSVVDLSVVDGLARSAVIVLLISLIGRLLGSHPIMFILNKIQSAIFPGII